MFLENGGAADPYYRRRREKLHFFMIECRESFENCFCVSMGSNATDNYAAAFRFGEDSVEVEVKDSRFVEFFASGTLSSFAPEFVKENVKKVTVPSVEEMPPELFVSPLWDEYDSRCIACGRCNTSCVTCTCFSSLDLFYSDSRNCGERRRVWDGCHLDGFTDMAGGHLHSGRRRGSACGSRPSTRSTISGSASAMTCAWGAAGGRRLSRVHLLFGVHQPGVGSPEGGETR